MQGRGVGSALLEPALARADGEGMPCYLETQKEENLSFYARHGFAVRDTALPVGRWRGLALDWLAWQGFLDWLYG